MDVDDFLKLLKAKDRDFVYPPHSIDQAIRRQFLAGPEDSIPIFENNIHDDIPYKVVEQEPADDERTLKLYYKNAQSKRGGFNVYVIIINSQIRLKTVYWTSKSVQKDAYRIIKRIPRRRKRL